MYGDHEVLKTKHFQYVKLASIRFCSNNFDSQLIKNVIDVGKYRGWFESVAGDKQKTIQSCMDDSAKHLMRMTICCGNFSAQVLEYVLNLICSKHVEDKFLSPICSIFTLNINNETRNTLFQLIEKSNICHDQCPLKPGKAPTKRISKRKSKRQFDLASIFDNIAQFMCGDVFEESAHDEWHLIELGIQVEQQLVEQEYLLIALLTRRPTCCLFQQNEPKYHD